MMQTKFKLGETILFETQENEGGPTVKTWGTVDEITVITNSKGGKTFYTSGKFTRLEEAKIVGSVTKSSTPPVPAQNAAKKKLKPTRGGRKPAAHQLKKATEHMANGHATEAHT